MRFKGMGLPWCFLEHPEDPKLCSKSPNASRCSTIWKTQAVQRWCKSLGLTTIHFDQCQLGQCVAKSTVLATDLPLRHWAGMSCTHGTHKKPSGVTSGDLSRYPPLMMQGLAQAIWTHLQSNVQPPPQEDRAHSLQSSVVGATEETKDRPTTTPTSRIQALLDPTVLVRLETSLSIGGSWQEDPNISSTMDPQSLRIDSQAGEGAPFPWRPTTPSQGPDLPWFTIIMQCRPAVLPGTHPHLGQAGRRSRLRLLHYFETGSTPWCGYTGTPKPKHLANKGRTQRWTLTGHDPRCSYWQGKLPLSGDPLRWHPGHISWREGNGHGLGTLYTSGGSLLLPLLSIGIMPGADGGHWWRGQGPDYLWWLLGGSQCSYPGKLWGTHYSSHGYGLHAWDPLASGSPSWTCEK